jgi:hypothetical protein
MVIARAAVRFKTYTRWIRDTPDGKALNFIANAMLLSLPYAVLFGMASTFKTLFVDSPRFSQETTLSNLLPLAVFVIVTGLLATGAYKLSRLLPNDPAVKQRSEHVALTCTSAFLLIVTPFIQRFHDTVPQVLDDDNLHHFSLSPDVLVPLYIVPFALVWLVGLLSTVKLAEYSYHVTGRIYRPMVRNLYLGILLSYTSTYLTQIFYLSNIPSNRFGPGLLILVGLLALLILGYGLMYRGANQLYSLEKD